MAKKPTGLAGFLGRVSGVELLKKQLHKYQDRKRLQRYREEREALTISQTTEHKALTRRHEMQLLDVQRKVRALGKIEKREPKSLEESLRREARIQDRGSRDHLPSLAPVLKRTKEKEKEQAREAAEDAREEFNGAASGRPRTRPIELKRDFDLAAGNEPVDEEDSDSGEVPKPTSETKVRRYRRKRKRDQDFDRGR